MFLQPDVGFDALRWPMASPARPITPTVARISAGRHRRRVVDLVPCRRRAVPPRHLRWMRPSLHRRDVLDRSSLVRHYRRGSASRPRRTSPAVAHQHRTAACTPPSVACRGRPAVLTWPRRPCRRAPPRTTPRCRAKSTLSARSGDVAQHFAPGSRAPAHLQRWWPGSPGRFAEFSMMRACYGGARCPPNAVDAEPAPGRRARRRQRRVGGIAPSCSSGSIRRTERMQLRRVASAEEDAGVDVKT